MIDGINTIKITGAGGRFTFWVNPANYLPVKANLGRAPDRVPLARPHSGQPGQAEGDAPGRLQAGPGAGAARGPGSLDPADRHGQARRVRPGPAGLPAAFSTWSRWPRTPRGASSGTRRTRAGPPAASQGSANTRCRGPGWPGHRTRTPPAAAALSRAGAAAALDDRAGRPRPGAGRARPAPACQIPAPVLAEHRRDIAPVDPRPRESRAGCAGRRGPRPGRLHPDHRPGRADRLRQHARRTGPPRSTGPAPRPRAAARSTSSTAPASASAAPGWTCQNAPALTRQVRPAALWCRCRRRAARSARRPRGTSTGPVLLAAGRGGRRGAPGRRAARSPATAPLGAPPPAGVTIAARSPRPGDVTAATTRARPAAPGDPGRRDQRVRDRAGPDRRSPRVTGACAARRRRRAAPRTWTRVRQPSPSASPGSGSTVTSRSRPAIRRSCWPDHRGLERRCAAEAGVLPVAAAAAARAGVRAGRLDPVRRGRQDLRPPRPARTWRWSR